MGMLRIRAGERRDATTRMAEALCTTSTASGDSSSPGSLASSNKLRLPDLAVSLLSPTFDGKLRPLSIAIVLVLPASDETHRLSSLAIFSLVFPASSIHLQPPFVGISLWPDLAFLMSPSGGEFPQTGRCDFSAMDRIWQLTTPTLSDWSEENWVVAGQADSLVFNSWDEDQAEEEMKIQIATSIIITITEAIFIQLL
ncbi:hypothetical protein ACLOJK_011550 [Asimina triloba]